MCEGVKQPMGEIEGQSEKQQERGQAGKSDVLDSEGEACRGHKRGESLKN